MFVSLAKLVVVARVGIDVPTMTVVEMTWREMWGHIIVPVAVNSLPWRPIIRFDMVCGIQMN